MGISIACQGVVAHKPCLGSWKTLLANCHSDLSNPVSTQRCAAWASRRASRRVGTLYQGDRIGHWAGRRSRRVDAPVLRISEMEARMQNLAGTMWKLIDASAFDEAGREMPSPLATANGFCHA
jgi:hypothetical protein